MISEPTRRKRAPIEIELWTSEPVRRFEELGPIAVRVRAAAELSPELERRLDRRLARAAHGAGAEAVVRVERGIPTGTGAARAFEARGLAVRWTEPPPPPSRPGTAAAAVSATSSLSGLGHHIHVGHEAPPLETIVRDLPAVRTAARRLATAATATPARRRVAQALTGALESRAQQLAIDPAARARLQRWAHEAKAELAAHSSRPHPPQPQQTFRLPGGCAFVLIAIFALIVFNVMGTCVRVLTSIGQ